MYCKVCGEQLNEGQAVCLKCGVEAGKGKGFCPNCGNAVHEEAVICPKCGISLKDNGNTGVASSNATATAKPNTAAYINHRSIAMAFILSLVTCGIYSIYWFVVLTNEMNQASGRTSDTSGGVCFLLGIVTCGIYNIYWAYKMGEKRDIVVKENSSSNVLYLILALFGFSIVVNALAQDALNKKVARA